MRFTKMNGAGNDFILLDAIAEPFDESAAPALALSLIHISEPTRPY